VWHVLQDQHKELIAVPVLLHNHLMSQRMLVRIVHWDQLSAINNANVMPVSSGMKLIGLVKTVLENGRQGKQEDLFSDLDPNVRALEPIGSLIVKLSRATNVQLEQQQLHVMNASVQIVIRSSTWRVNGVSVSRDGRQTLLVQGV